MNQEIVKLNRTHRLIGYADDVNILGGSILNLNKNTEALVVANKEIGLEVNAGKIKYMVVSQDQNARQNHSIKMYNKFFERWNSYFETTLMNQSSIQEEIKSRSKAGNVCLLACSAELLVFQFVIQKYKN